MLNVNKKEYELDVEPYESLLNTLRDRLCLKGCKKGCDYGGCGACTVLLDDLAVYSCMTPVEKVQRRKITTIEGLGANGGVDTLQDSFNKSWAVQCGYCSAGMILSAKALIDRKKSPTEAEIREALVGNLCTCTGYIKVIDAVLAAAKSVNGLG
ncbi:MAG: (2Fe-2S)-binding protein [Nitrososphaerota archaeon]|nr:(2Fe-2S)-binding protein [Nitrososphaerota archaeon]